MTRRGTSPYVTTDATRNGHQSPSRSGSYARPGKYRLAATRAGVGTAAGIHRHGAAIMRKAAAIAVGSISSVVLHANARARTVTRYSVAVSAPRLNATAARCVSRVRSQ